ncbi:hypothetical protein CP978_24545 [Streptomyces nodosus]|uniref:Lipoprotein n=1 Tax=Streptomyces nodosus TaxID=40318 RepID=A0A0B5DHX2_9ACTN|nr:lipoprotein [Streptomyces nodosus]QEV43472.1 hypothetical protein CP978_24545 [Streptomyces nodosus]
MLASAAGVALLAGCSAAPDPAARSSALSSADRARARAARDSAALAERYAQVIAAHPGLADRLRPLRAEVLRHVQAFGGASGASGAASGSASASASSPASASASASVTPSASGAVPSSASGPASASGSASASASAGASSVPEDPKAALKGLATAERNLADRRAEALLDLPGESARLMASVAAAGAVHAYLLTEGGK